MKTEIVLYDHMLADASLGSVLCFRQVTPPMLDRGQRMEKIAKFDIRGY